MKCFRCANEIVELAADDPRRAGTGVSYGYWPVFVVEVLKENSEACRAAVLCWPCVNEVDLDMWLSGDQWDADKPAVPFDQLPIYDHDSDAADEPETYASVIVPARPS